MKWFPASVLALAITAVFSSTCFAQATPPAPSNGPAGTGGAAPVAPMPPEVRSLVQILHDRRNTLKDFTAKADYSVYHVTLDDAGGKRGTVDFVMDAQKGPIFSIDFTEKTDEKGKVVSRKEEDHQQIIFDGTEVLVLDVGVKEYIRTRVLPEGSKPGDATSLNGKLTIPIGIDPDDVNKHFIATIVPNPDSKLAVVTTLPAKAPPAGGDNPDWVTVHLVPRQGSRFDFRQMDITIDKKLELPVQMAQEDKTGDITTIRVSEIQVNTGKAKVPELKIPDGYKERAGTGSSPAATGASPTKLP